MQFYIFLFVHLASKRYTGICRKYVLRYLCKSQPSNNNINPFQKVSASVLTLGVHRKILYHLNEKFVNLPGITAQIKLKRKKQNVCNFRGSIFFSTWRFCSVLAMCVICLLPGKIMSQPNGFILYIVIHWISSVYETCGVSIFFLASCTIFNNGNLMGNSKKTLKMRMCQKN